MKAIRRTAILSAAILAACGGGGSDSPPLQPEPPPPQQQTGFSEATTWTLALPAAGEAACFDFDAGADVACSGTAWDIKVASGGRSATLATNSGPSGEGSGGAFATPFDHTWTELKGWTDAFTDATGAVIPERLYFPDSAAGVFTGDNGIQAEAFEYDLNADHLLYPTFKVFLITTDATSADPVGTPAAPVFALQVTGYYGGPSGDESGHVSFQWIDRAAPSALREATVDARDGWVYYDLVTGSESSEGGNWQIAFNRYNVRLNGGASGAGSTAGFLAKTPAGLYDADGNPVVAGFMNATPAAMAAELTATDLSLPADADDWVADTAGSQLAPAYQGSWPSPLDYGWYTYYPSTATAQAVGLAQHMLAANPDRGALVRSGEGDSFARMRLASIVYADPADATSAQTWTFEFDVQPARSTAR